MKINIEELEACFKRVIKELKELSIENPIELDTNYYLTIPSHQWRNQNNLKYNQTPNVGSLYDDIESLKNMLNKPEISCTFVDFDRIASVLRAISQEFNSPYKDEKKDLNLSKKRELRKKVTEGRKKELQDQLHKYRTALSQIEEALE